MAIVVIVVVVVEVTKHNMLCNCGFMDNTIWPESSRTLCLEEVRQVTVPAGHQTTTVLHWVHQNAALRSRDKSKSGFRQFNIRYDTYMSIALSLMKSQCSGFSTSTTPHGYMRPLTRRDLTSITVFDPITANGTASCFTQTSNSMLCAVQMIRWSDNKVSRGKAIWPQWW